MTRAAGWHASPCGEDGDDGGGDGGGGDGKCAMRVLSVTSQNYKRHIKLMYFVKVAQNESRSFSVMTRYLINFRYISYVTCPVTTGPCLLM